MTTDNVGEQLADCLPQYHSKVTFVSRKELKTDDDSLLILFTVLGYICFIYYTVYTIHEVQWV